MAWIIAGLGNPGYEYEGTRHNTGRMAVEYFAKSAKFSEWKEDPAGKRALSGAGKKAMSLVSRGVIGKTLVALVLPNTFMNKSGAAVAKFVKPASSRGGSASGGKAAERMAVVYDDLDLPLGTMKISFNRGSGGHKGVESIMKVLKTKKFTRVRVGVSQSTASGAIRKPVGEKVVVNYILTKFKAHELEILKGVFKKVSRALEVIATEGPVRAMNEFN